MKKNPTIMAITTIYLMHQKLRERGEGRGGEGGEEGGKERGREGGDIEGKRRY